VESVVFNEKISIVHSQLADFLENKSELIDFAVSMKQQGKRNFKGLVNLKFILN
jgi:hypothetical protein